MEDRMRKRILLIQGHPDKSEGHLCHALGIAYADGAIEAGHDVRHIDVATLDFPLLHSQREWKIGELPPGLRDAQQAIQWCDHMVLIFPLWLGDMPALLKGFLEQVARPGFALGYGEENGFPKKMLAGRSARVIVTMGMPAAVYRFYFRAHSVKSLERNILGFVGFAPVSETLIGRVDNMSPVTANKWFAKLKRLAARAG
jgi:putative NADPH-quinone reductase